MRFAYGTGSANSYANWGYKANSDGNKIFLSIANGGSAADILVAQADGNVGIGTSTPGQKLEVTSGHIKLSAGYSLQWDDSHERIEQSDGNLEFFTNNGQQMTINGSNVGIGTTTPAGKLQAYTSANRFQSLTGAAADLEIVSDNNTNPVALIKGTGSADLLNVFDNTTEVFTILDGGNVGIGPSSPSFKLHVSGTNTAIAVESTSTNQNSGIYFRAHGASQWETGVNITAGLNYEIYDRVNNLSRFVVDHSGNVMIGTTVAPSGTGLAVSSNISSSQITAIEIQQNTTGAKKAAAAFGVAIQNGGASTNAADLTIHTASGGSLSERMRITSGGIVAGRHLSGQGYISFNSHASGGGNYVNIKTNIYRASKMYTLLIIGHISYSGERIHSIITGYAYAPLQGNTSSSYHGITNHGSIGVNVYYSSDDYLCIKTTGAGSYNSINIIGSSGAVNYYQTNPIEVLAYTSIAGTGNHYA